MWITWRKRLDMQPSLRDFSGWPFIDINDVSKEKRAGFLRNKKIVASVAKGYSLASVAQENHISRGFIYRLMKRALESEDIDEPPLTQALLPYENITKRSRKSELPTLTNSSSSTCCFSHLLDNVPNLKQGLDAAIDGYVKDKAYGQNLTPKIFHKEFLRLLAEANWPTDVYPYTDASQAYESARQYFHKTVAEMRQPKRRRTRTVMTINGPIRPLEEIEIDEQTIDQSASIAFEMFGRVETERLSRCSLVLVVDVATKARLAWHLALTKHPAADDILAALKAMYVPWQPLEITTPGLEYPPGAMLPSALGEPYSRMAPRKVRLDNALSHHANTVRDFVCNELGATLNLGLPQQPKTRVSVEHAFKLASQQQHRSKSTTGSSASDVRRESKKNRKHAPIITLQTMREILSISIAGYNAEPKAELGGKTPLEIIEESPLAMLPLLGMAGRQVPNPFLRTDEATLHVPQKENRPAYINFCYERYSVKPSTQLPARTCKVRIKYDSEDIRTLTAYSLSGELLGEFKVSQKWMRHPHSIAIRKKIHKAVKAHKLSAADPLAGYFAYLLENKSQPTSALALTHLAQDTSTLEGLEPLPLPSDEPSYGLRSGRQQNNHIKSWDEL